MEIALSEWGGDILTTVIYFAVGIKLWNLSRRTGEKAERLLAVAAFFWGASYVVWDVPFLLTGGDERLFPLLSMASFTASDVGNVYFAVFTLVVFRPGERWAIGLVAVIAASMAVGIAGSAWVGDWDLLGANGSHFYWLERIGASATSVWLGFEAIRFYLPARRRRALGLCGPMLCNRFALWGITAALWVGMDAAMITHSLIIAEGGTAEALAFVIQFQLIFRTLGAVLIAVNFFPPTFYRNWVEGSSSGEVATG
jgi:hypothetical protein